MTKPLIVYVSGAPGSGKTTLAKLIADQLYIPHVSSDTIHGGVAFWRPSHHRQETLRNVFVPTMIDLAQKGVCFVVDHVLLKGLSENDIINNLKPHAEIVYIHTQCTDPIARYTKRVATGILPHDITQKDFLLSRATVHQNNLPLSSQPLDLGLPTLVVNTDDGYNPNLETILAFIDENYAK